MKRRMLIKAMAGVLATSGSHFRGRQSKRGPTRDMYRSDMGPFQPSWNSLQQYAAPDWFRDAKFGIWAVWGPQCQPEYGDWYARSMYSEGSMDYQYHLRKYGHPSTFGFKDVIREWKAERWDPDSLLSLYRRAGARYFVAMANHHDNFDNYNSSFQSWNSTAIGPKKDVIGGWARAARQQGLRFGVSVHAAHAWTFYEKSQKADIVGPKAGVPYDGTLRTADGKGFWWDGLDPQELYAQTHLPSPGADNNQTFSDEWDWTHGVTIPNKPYCEKFFRRTIDLIDQYRPDLVYFDDTVLPLYGVSDVGLRIAAHYYNSNRQWNNGRLEAVINGKILDEQQRKCLVWDIERGQSMSIEPLPWQTDTCLGDWHYDRTLFERHGYKTARSVIHRLADVVSKNGNLLLSVPVRGDGSIDSDEEAIVEEIAEWIKDNGESIYGTRPWKIFREGPSLNTAAPLKTQGFNEDSGKPFTGRDIRFTAKKGVLYAIALGAPAAGRLLITSLAAGSLHYPGSIGEIKLCTTGQSLAFIRGHQALTVMVPESLNDAYAYSLKILPA